MRFYESSLDKKKQQQKPKYPDLPSFLETKVQANQKKNQSKPAGSASNLRDSVLLKNKEQQNEEGWFKKLCACTQLEYYKDFFKVTNDEVQKRILSNLKFWHGGFFQPATQDYDFYGPFWIYTTVVFCLGAVHNILQYQGNPNYDYDFEILGQAFFAMYALGFGLPVGIAFAMKGIGVNCTVIQILCLYGYSVSIYIFCIILCSFNICLLHWIFLGYAVANKIFFVFKNIHEGFEIPASKKILITILIAIEGALQFFIFKIRFIYCADQVIPTGPQKHFLQLPQTYDFVHFRSFQHDQVF